MTEWRTIPLLLLSLLLLAGPVVFAPNSTVALSLLPLPPLVPLPSDDDDDRDSAPAEELLAVDAAEHIRRAVERHAPRHRQLVILPPRRHHAPALMPLTPPAPFWAAVNPPLHC